MTAAAFQASYADFKLIKGRKCAQIILEVPIEAADAALNALGGVPQPQIETWLAVARLDTKAAPEPPKAITAPPKERRSWSSLSYAEQAGIRCQEPAFWQFLNEDYGEGVSSSEGAAIVVRGLCGDVTSRAEILPHTEAGHVWVDVDREYDSWLRRPPL